MACCVYPRLREIEKMESGWEPVMRALLAADLPVPFFDLAIDRLHDRLNPPPGGHDLRRDELRLLRDRTGPRRGSTFDTSRYRLRRRWGG